MICFIHFRVCAVVLIVRIFSFLLSSPTAFGLTVLPPAFKFCSQLATMFRIATVDQLKKENEVDSEPYFDVTATIQYFKKSR